MTKDLVFVLANSPVVSLEMMDLVSSPVGLLPQRDHQQAYHISLAYSLFLSLAAIALLLFPELQMIEIRFFTR
jgi:hypothetical protein